MRTPALPLSALFATLLLAACTNPYSTPEFIAPKGQEALVGRVQTQLRDLEESTGKRFRGETVEIKQPTRAKYADWRGMPVAKIRGRYQGGLTSWKVMEGHATVYLAHAKGKIPEWLVRHESLHVILLSNGIAGHPRSYSRYFDKPYWWMPEGSLRRGAFLGDKEYETAAASCAPAFGNGEVLSHCPICGVTAAELRASSR
jgi:hypothetical protein